MEQIIVLIIQLIVVVAGYLIGKYVVPAYGADIMKELQFMSTLASNFVHYAAQYLNASGSDKMDYVCEELRKIAAEAGIVMTDEQIKSIIQKAYDAMKAGEKEANKEIEKEN